MCEALNLGGPPSGIPNMIPGDGMKHEYHLGLMIKLPSDCWCGMCEALNLGGPPSGIPNMIPGDGMNHE